MSVARINSHLHTLRAPDELGMLEGWVLWRYEAGDGPKPRKVPYYADGGRRHGVQGRREDRLRMVTFDAAKAAAARRNFDGVGLCLLPEFGIVVVDFDNVMTSQGIRPDVAALVADTYAEFSPGGGGAHAIYRGNLGNHKAHGAPFGLETFSSTGFVTFTGNALPHVADLDLVGPLVAPVSQALRTLCSQRFGPAAAAEDDDPLMNYSPVLGLTEAQLRDALEVLDPNTGHDDWLRVGMALHHETAGQGFHLWDEWSAASPKYPGAELLQKRWDSFGRETGKRTTARSLVKMANAAGARIVTGVATAEDLAQPAVVEDGSKPARFGALTLAELMNRPRARWTIKRVLPESGVGMVYGPSMSGKSFFVLDLCMAVARGVDWRDRKVRQGAVAYIAAEGVGGFPDRVRAYLDFHGCSADDIPLRVIPAAPNLLEKGDVKDLVQELKRLPPLRIVVVDTLAQTTAGGDENASSDMGRALAHCKAIGEATGALVLLVGHTGKDEDKGPRGHSSQIAAFDVAIQLERDGELREAAVRKLKDGIGEGDTYPFHLNSVVLDQDEDGDDITSCVVLEGHAGGVVRSSRKGPKGAVQQLVLRKAQEFLDLGGELQIMTLINAAIEELPAPDDGKRDQRRKEVMRAFEWLVGAGFVSGAGGLVTLR